VRYWLRNAPLDVLDISSIRAPIGGVYRVKVTLQFNSLTGCVVSSNAMVCYQRTAKQQAHHH
jgi:hypothetical protein